MSCRVVSCGVFKSQVAQQRRQPDMSCSCVVVVVVAGTARIGSNSRDCYLIPKSSNIAARGHKSAVNRAIRRSQNTRTGKVYTKSKRYTYIGCHVLSVMVVLPSASEKQVVLKTWMATSKASHSWVGLPPQKKTLTWQKLQCHTDIATPKIYLDTLETNTAWHVVIYKIPRRSSWG